jgi:Dna[CI] antecedent, DciA
VKRRYRLPHLLSLDHVLRKDGEHRFAKVMLPVSYALWRDVVGPHVATRAAPILLARRALLVRVTSSAWAQELSLLAPTIVARLQEAGIEVTSLRFRVGEVIHHDRPPERRLVRIVPAAAPIPSSLEASLERVDDAELAGVLRASIGSSLALNKVHASSLALNKVHASSLALNKVHASSLALNKVHASAGSDQASANLQDAEKETSLPGDSERREV